MWLFTRDGFYSVVARDGVVVIRTRSHLALRRLRDKLQLPDPILVGAGTDYKYRICVEWQTWIAVATSLASEVTYPNFKQATEDRQGPRSAYVRALHDVWARLKRKRMRCSACASCSCRAW